MPYATHCDHCDRWLPGETFADGLCPGCESLGHTSYSNECKACAADPMRVEERPKRRRAPRKEQQSVMDTQPPSIRGMYLAICKLTSVDARRADENILHFVLKKTREAEDILLDEVLRRAKK